MDTILLRYNKWRAVVAVAVPIAVIAFVFFPILLGWLEISGSRQWIGVIACCFGFIWWSHVLVADALKTFRYERSFLSFDNDVLVLPSGEHMKLSDIERVYPEKRFWRKPVVRIVTCDRRSTLLTTFQDFGSELNADRISERILNSRNSSRAAMKINP